MFVVVALSIWAALNTYVLWRVASVPAVARHVSRKAIVIAGIILALSYLVARIAEASGAGIAGVALEWIGAQWMGTLTIAFGCFAVADIVTGFGFFFRARVPAVRALALAASAVLTIVAVVNAYRAPVVRDYEVRIANLPPDRDGMVMAAISDLHLGTLTGRAWLEERIVEVEALKPDIIVILGDLAEGDGKPEDELPTDLRRLRAPLGVWAVPGNHERHGGGEADALMRAAGIRLLRDAWGEVAPGLVIAGVDSAGHQHVPGRGLVEKALSGRPAGAATILLSHEPSQVERAASDGVGLMLAGHTHNGQIWPFDLFVRIAYPWLGGRYEVGGMPLIVCRGTGTWGPKMRLWHPNEMLRIVLRRG